MSQFTTEKEVAIKAAKTAGLFLRDKRGEIVVDASVGKDIKLAVDKESEGIIVDILRAGADHPVLAEEGGGEPLLASPSKGEESLLQWVVDPLDGSLNYFRGMPNAVVSIGLLENGKPVLGVIYDFFRDDLYVGVVGDGAMCNGEPINVSTVSEPGQGVLTMGFPSATDYSDEPLMHFVREVQQFKKVRLLGSAALSLAYVASGKADAYMERDIHLWDVAAGMAIVEAAGGATVRDTKTGETTIDLFVTNKSLNL